VKHRREKALLERAVKRRRHSLQRQRWPPNCVHPSRRVALLPHLTHCIGSLFHPCHRLSTVLHTRLQQNRRHYAEWFPALCEIHRTTFARQAANLWKVKEHLWQELLLALVPHDPTFAICDSMPLPACLFARAHRCRRFRGEAAFGKDTLLKQTFYGFRMHVRVCWPGVITRLSVVPANVHELSVLPELLESTRGVVVGDRNYWSPETKKELATTEDVELLAPYRSKKRDPAPQRSAYLSRLRYRIDTVFSQLTERYCIKKVWARDLWHLAGRLLRKVLSHTVAFLLNHQMGNRPLQLSRLLH
jgi:hypothetical protein